MLYLDPSKSTIIIVLKNFPKIDIVAQLTFYKIIYSQINTRLRTRMKNLFTASEDLLLQKIYRVYPNSTDKLSGQIL
jgi:hypothetical protein